VSGRAKRVYYTHPWDLSGLPNYKPQQIVAGTIREWGSNYFADSDLNEYWETEFHKWEPDVKFDVHMRTAWRRHRPCHRRRRSCCCVSSPSQRRSFTAAFNHEPLRILIATGSYDVPGWSRRLRLLRIRTTRFSTDAAATRRYLRRCALRRLSGNDVHRRPDALPEDIRTWDSLALRVNGKTRRYTFTVSIWSTAWSRLSANGLSGG